MKTAKLIALGLLFPFTLALAAKTARAERETLPVSAAPSLTDALSEIGKLYEAGSQERPSFNFGASNLLESQIEAGAPVDLFLSADEASVDRLDQKGLLLAGSRISLLSNTLVIVVETRSNLAIHSAQDLASDRIRSIALAEPGSVPAGIYAKKYLQSAGVWDSVSAKVIPTENVRGALAAVEAGNADAAIVYATDARISKKVRVAYEVPAARRPKISYGAAVIRDSRHLEAARRFLAYLGSPTALAIFRRFGFLPAP
jgi:molybdate transport system substrate-binding protein